MKPFFELIFGIATEDHLSQILAGFQMLKVQGKLDFNIQFSQDYIKKKYGHRAIVEAKAGEKVIVYDLTDGYHNIHDFGKFDNVLDAVDFYFKRSNNIEINLSLNNRDKICPLGLNYHVSCKGNPYDRYYNWKGLKGTALIKDYLFYLRSNKRFQKKYYYGNFESDGKRYERYNVMFNCRLYDSEVVKYENIRTAYADLSENQVNAVVEKWKKDLRQVTEQRIQIVQTLKDTFGERFIGGISNDPYSRQIAPKLLVNENDYMKYNYLKSIKANHVCVSSKGLHHSIGWKFGEYVAAGKAIVSDKLEYEVPGDFHKGRNYLEYENPENLVKVINDLFENIDKIHELEKNNREYYEKNLRPDSLIKNTLIQVGFLLE